MAATQIERAECVIRSDSRRAIRWMCGSLIALACCTYVLLTEIAPVATTLFAGAVPGGWLLPWLAVAQLVVVAVTQGLKARAIRRADDSTVGAPERLSVLAYGLIVLFGALGLSRGPQSGFLIAGYDDLLAAIVTSSAVSLLLHVIDLRSIVNLDRAQEPHSISPVHGHRVARWIEAIAAATFAVACMIVEVSA